MKVKTILKQIDDVLALWRGDKKKKQKAIKKLVELRNRLALKVQEEEKRKKLEEKIPPVNQLVGWYIKIWQGKIPEGHPGRAGIVFKELLKNYKLSEEEIKDVYLWWIKLHKENVPKKLQNTYSIVLTHPDTRSITDFKGKLRYIKGLKRELEENSPKKWTSPENERGDDFYKKAIKELTQEDENFPEEINLSDEDLKL